jgi:hypothetical protein
MKYYEDRMCRGVAWYIVIEVITAVTMKITIF